MKALTSKQRRALPNDAFALPETRQYPIPDKAHAKLALDDMGREPAKVQKQIIAAVNERYPGMVKQDTILTHGPITNPGAAKLRE